MGRGVNAADQLAEEIYGLHCDIGRLETENARLRGFWTRDGAWNIELPRLPDVIVVRLPDGRDRKVHTARIWRYVCEEVNE